VQPVIVRERAPAREPADGAEADAPAARGRRKVRVPDPGVRAVARDEVDARGRPAGPQQRGLGGGQGCERRVAARAERERERLARAAARDRVHEERRRGDGSVREPGVRVVLLEAVRASAPGRAGVGIRERTDRGHPQSRGGRGAR
jgi:hypothetical protein